MKRQNKKATNGELRYFAWNLRELNKEIINSFKIMDNILEDLKRK
ncbi:MAG: hypothetical protein AABX08_04585 [Nanoarchaeota archaeon]